MSDLWISQMRKGLVELCVLAAVRDGADYGYAIVKALSRTDALAFTESTVYPAVSRLTNDGCLVTRQAHSSDGPSRRLLSLAPAGKERLAAMTAYWVNLSHSVDALLAGDPSGSSEP